MSSSLQEEQSFVDSAYELLGDYLEDLRRRRDSLTNAPATGTGQDVLEREALLGDLHRQERAALAGSNRLCFGRIDADDGTSHRIGRIGLRTPEGDPLLLDWRAPHAAPFYQATTVDPMGLKRRRRIIIKEDGSTHEVTHVDDEFFGDLAGATSANNEAAAASVLAPRDGRMADILATIATDQDAIIRSPLAGVTVVEGGPGTGKTVVALHRAAWLLYTYRDRLAQDGVLIIGPSPVFLRYIDQVLPSLGETDVVLLTPGQLYPGVSTSKNDATEVARIKGDLRMVSVMARLVDSCKRVPDHDITIRMENGKTIPVTTTQLRSALKAVPKNATFHEAREPFLRRLLDHMARTIARSSGDDPDDVDVRTDIIGEIVDDIGIRRTLNLMWLPTTPERLLSRFFSDEAFATKCAQGILTNTEVQLLQRDPAAPWTVDDVPLLDECADLLGVWTPPTRAASRSDVDELDARSLHTANALHVERSGFSIVERALSDREWVYGHVVVDEAQELSRMAWRSVQRRAVRRSMTIVGDLQQGSHPAGARSWQQALEWASDSISVHQLSVTYRITRQTADTASELLQEAGGSAPHLTAIRDGSPTIFDRIDEQDLANFLVQTTADEPGRVVAIVPDRQLESWNMALTSAEFGRGETAVDARIAVLPVRDTKGLEFDIVFVVDPDEISRQAPNGADIYVACTRATRDLHLVTINR